MCEHGRVVQLFLQSSVSLGQHTAALRWPQQHRRCDTLIQRHAHIRDIWFFLDVKRVEFDNSRILSCL